MSKTTVHQWNGMLLSLFQFNAGDKIPKHRHPFVHTTGVARGSTEVEIYGHGTFTMKPGDRDVPFPPDVDHEIRALEDDTIVVNLSYVQGEAKAGQDGGIAFE